MPIPDFDKDTHVIPPFVGDSPANWYYSSPYYADINEVSLKLGTNNRRRQILKGLIELRLTLMELGLTGFQWLDGSFLENVEQQNFKMNSPSDIDVVTFISDCKESHALADRFISAGREDLLQPPLTKEIYHVDHYLIPLSTDPENLVDLTRYWYGLFSHQKATLTWKGIIQTPMLDVIHDKLVYEKMGGSL